MKTHIMLDLETLGTSSNAVIISIGACIFEPVSGEVNETDVFHEAIDFSDAFKNGIADGDTIKWWMSQSEQARKSVMVGTQSVVSALNSFISWAGPLNPLVWGNGADFDNVILANQYRRMGIKQPWGLYNNRCFRTLKNITGYVPPGAISTAPPARQGIHHNALHDAIYQAKVACWIARQYGLTLS